MKKVVYVILELKPFVNHPLVLINEAVWSKGKRQQVLCDDWFFETEESAEIYCKKKYGDDFLSVVMIIPLQSRGEFVKESLKHKNVAL